MPAHNEGEVIGGVIRDIRRACHYEIFVVDDASTDDTIRAATEAGATVIPLAAQLGAWGATQTGLRYALRSGIDTVISMDADGQHSAASIPELLAPVLNQQADVVIGACTQRGSILRKIAWRLMKRTSGLALEDITSGFRVYNNEAVKALASWRATLLDYQDVGVLMLLQAKGMRIKDMPVKMQPRIDGKSRIFHSWVIVAYYMSQTLVLGMSKRRARHSSNKYIVRGQ
ncbi:MAG: glycosyltransferase family 2 protein [Halieaceae bacterium]|nr:glycosyltransferase family 2 protein [Halieaceae bacterium]